MQQILLDFIFKQLPVIVVLGFLCYFMYKYFTKVIDDLQARFTKGMEDKDRIFNNMVEAKDHVIHSKDEEIKSLNTKLLDLTSRCLMSTDKSNEIMVGLKDLIMKLIKQAN